MQGSVLSLSTVQGVVLAALLAGCAGGDPGPDAEGAGAAEAAPFAAQGDDAQVAAPDAAGDAGAPRQAASAAAEPLAPVGEVLKGWDPRRAVAAYWELEAPAHCDEAGPDEPCLDTWQTEGNRSAVAVARLDPAAGPGLSHALELQPHVQGYEVLQAWDAESGTGLPDWARAD